MGDTRPLTYGDMFGSVVKAKNALIRLASNEDIDIYKINEEKSAVVFGKTKAALRAAILNAENWKHIEAWNNYLIKANIIIKGLEGDNTRLKDSSGRSNDSSLKPIVPAPVYNVLILNLKSKSSTCSFSKDLFLQPT